MAKKNYVIVVGPERPEKMLQGTLDRRSSQPTADVTEVSVPVGTYIIPNYSEVWGRRLSSEKSKNKKGDVVHSSDKDYKGELEFLSWGDPDGYRVIIRHLSSAPNTLDLEYQKQVLKLVAGDEDQMLTFSQGQNRYDYTTEELFIQFLKTCHYNEDSKSKNPTLTGSIVFYELTETREDKGFAKQMEGKAAAMLLVSSLSTKPASLRLLANVLHGQIEAMYGVDEHTTDIGLYTALFKAADTEPGKLNGLVDNFKKAVKEEFKKAETFNKLDLTKDGTIALIDESGKKSILLERVDAKGADKMIEWVIDNIFVLEVDLAYRELQQVNSKL